MMPLFPLSYSGSTDGSRLLRRYRRSCPSRRPPPPDRRPRRSPHPGQEDIMIEWFAHHPWATGCATFVLMWSDWVLTIAQERERRLHYFEHYASYPVNTIEGHPLFQSAVKKRRVAEPTHMIPAVILSAIVAYALVWIPQAMRAVL